jgi:putative transposase
MARRIASRLGRGRSGQQLGFRFRTWGGVRAGAGRRPTGTTSGVSHLRRDSVARRHPLHVTLRVRRGLPSLRAHTLFGRVRRALAQGRDRFGFRLVQFSVQSDHLHLLVEANDRRALSRGVQGLSIRVARAANRELKRKGRFFADRYHARALTTPLAVRCALRYVLLNARKHERRNAQAVPAGFIDPCSSAAWFEGFARPRGLAFGVAQCRAGFARERLAMDAPVVAPHTWLLRVGYRRAPPFDVDETPAS